MADWAGKPVVIGHSFGGLIAQRLLGQDLAAAAVGIDAAPIKGVLFVPPSALRVASIALRNPANAKRAVSPSSPAKVNTGNPTRGPLLLIAGGRDHTVPASVTRSTHKLYRNSAAVTDFQEFPDRGHSLALDGGWREVANAALGWLREKAPAAPPS